MRIFTHYVYLLESDGASYRDWKRDDELPRILVRRANANKPFCRYPLVDCRTFWGLYGRRAYWRNYNNPIGLPFFKIKGSMEMDIYNDDRLTYSC